MLTLQQFDILNLFFKNQDKKYTQREISDITEISLGKVNETLKELKDNKFLDEDLKITEAGFEALEPYKVDNAIIMAAGMSSRFAPLCYESPKGLLNVKGEKLIEREILQLKEAGIEDITLVVGYMKEKMFYLAEKFGVDIVVNSDYYRFNNTSSLILVTEKLKNTYICSSDNYFPKNPFEKYVYRAYYPIVYQDGESDEYFAEFDKKGRITGITIGGKDSWIMLGHVFFDREFSDRFVKLLKAEYHEQTVRENLWETFYMRHLKELDNMYIRKYDVEDIKEFDSLEELRIFDEKYVTNSDSKIFQNICGVLKCNEEEIKDIKPIKTGMTKTSFKFSQNGKSYVYRHRGLETELIINRKSEFDSMKIAKELGLDDTYIYMDSEKGWKISNYIEDVRVLDYEDKENVRRAISMLKKLHTSGRKTDFEFNIFEEIENFKLKIKNSHRDDFEDMNLMNDKIYKLKEFLDKDNVKNCLCHCNSYNLNFLMDKNDGMYLIDWEYSAMSDPAGDIGCFITCSKYSFDESIEIIKEYFDGNPTDEELRHYVAYVAVSSFYWFLWAINQEIQGKSIGEYLYIWYNHTKEYADYAFKLYEQVGSNE
ncbi:NTP transferase domain-containing protein [uncultured Parvimonas sp.]|uniref:NTP transferase domain-containing protein n=1 Tax=uncultured Parvimonas sp. TaxID=747372 RepID=UPI0025972401|nr:NTP transferase domain-containing protein [uncultured Parvimonas sp.]